MLRGIGAADGYDDEGGDEFTYHGSEYTVSGDLEIAYDLMEDGEVWYSSD